MAKRLEMTIEKCANCPCCCYFSSLSHPFRFCSKNESYEIDDINRIPDWCPLQDECKQDECKYVIEYICPVSSPESREFELKRILCADEDGRAIAYRTEKEAQFVCDNKNLIINELKKMGYLYYSGFSVKKMENFENA